MEDTWALVLALLPSGCVTLTMSQQSRFLFWNKFMSLLIRSSFQFSNAEVVILYSVIKLQNTVKMAWSNVLFYWFRNWGWGWENDWSKIIKPGQSQDKNLHPDSYLNILSYMYFTPPCFLYKNQGDCHNCKRFLETLIKDLNLPSMAFQLYVIP